MSIIKKEFAAVQCDNCLDIAIGFDDIEYWTDEDSAVFNATESEWHCEDGKHYCPDCISWNDDDQLVIDPSRAALQKEAEG